MSRLIEVHPAAEIELDEAAGWYDDQRRGLGREFVVATSAALKRAARSPQLGSPVDSSDPRLGLRRVFVARFPYQLVYVLTGDVLHLIAVAHERRRPGYWMGRVT